MVHNTSFFFLLGTLAMNYILLSECLPLADFLITLIWCDGCFDLCQGRIINDLGAEEIEKKNSQKQFLGGEKILTEKFLQAPKMINGRPLTVDRHMQLNFAWTSSGRIIGLGDVGKSFQHYPLLWSFFMFYQMSERRRQIKSKFSYRWFEYPTIWQTSDELSRSNSIAKVYSKYVKWWGIQINDTRILILFAAAFQTFDKT